MVIYIKPDKESEDKGYSNDKRPKTKKKPKDLERVPKEYYIYLVFKKKIIDKLPDRISFDYTIKLKLETELKYHKVYHLRLR